MSYFVVDAFTDRPFGGSPACVEASFLQGEAMGRPSVIVTRIRPDGRIIVGGTACIVAEGRLVSTFLCGR